VATYVRSLVLAGDVVSRRTPIRAPVDEVALARVLASLGRSGLAASLSKLAAAAEIGILGVAPDTESDIRGACAAVLAMRDDLMRALGVDQDGAP
jgi:hypothetical protein